ncbi:MAG TPA: fatty acid desaturase [Caulobacteraceae bacterium]|nr:fatty acid desaturase [Caulobacteraceae bacterium]
MTVIPLAAVTLLAWEAMRFHIWWGLLLIPLAAAFLVRLFMIQHDCGHAAFLPWRPLNDWLGRALGVLTLTPYDYWRAAHAVHHASSGALDRRTLGGIETLTVDEYRALGPWRRLGYRVYRHPMVMFGVGPAFVFLLQHRLPVGLMRGGWKPWVSVLATDLGIAAMAVAMTWIFGLGPFLIVYLPLVTLAASAGVWLFFVQHQFEHAYWRRDGAWSFDDAALRGSSHYDLPAPLRWFTANIGVHHVHHLSSRIPYYRLGQVMREEPELRAATRLTLVGSLRCPRLALWNEAAGRLISFREMGRLARTLPTQPAIARDPGPGSLI